MVNGMNVIFLARSYYPNVGGVEKHVYEISKVLANSGYKITVITEESGKNGDKKSESDYKLNGVNVIRIPVGREDWFKKFRVWRWMWNHRELFLKSDVIHCHDVFFWYLPLAFLYPMKNVYTTFHGYEGYPIKKKAIVYRKIFEYMSNRTICIGDFMKKWYYAKPTIVSYGGVTLPMTISKPKKNSAIFIGRLDDQTGIETYVEAIKLIRKKIPTFTLTVYGNGPYKEKIKGEGIILKGFDSKAEKEISKYEFAFVSRYLAILEAMVAKRLVFAVYDNPVKEDYLKMAPYVKDIFLAKDSTELVEQILSIVHNPKIDIFKKENNYSWAKMQTWQELGHIYEKLWGEGGR